MNSKNLKIDNDNSERRLDNYLFSTYKALPKSKIYSMIRKGEVRVNSKRIKPSYKLKSEDEIRIPPYLINYNDHSKQVKIPQKRIDIYKKSILFENQNYVVINKESELPVHSGSKNSFGLIDIVRVINPNLDIDLCHRIDKSTSGCIVLSKNKKFLRNFHMQLKNNSVKKTYKAILAGSFEGKINTKSNNNISTQRYKHKVEMSYYGKKAITEFLLIKKLGNFSYTEIKILTGRKHQIRVQSANLGLPVVNDKKYGHIYLNKLIRKETGISRLALHSASISFLNRDGKIVIYEASINKDFEILLNNLQKLTIQS
jgi:23S rRNA pseudouridine955/2504/2580 synthase